MNGILLSADDLLRGTPWRGDLTHPRRVLTQLLLIIVAFGITYGAAMGTFGGIRGERFFQVVYSALKVPILLLVTFVISLPSFFVLNTLLGVRDDFAAALRALMSAQAGLTVILASLAPFTLLWYGSSDHYRLAIFFNAAMFAVASVSAQYILRRLYQPLIARNARHRMLLRVWLLIFMFVGIQMGWVLRPFIGDPHSPTQFFREGAWGNAYVVIARMLVDLLAP